MDDMVVAFTAFRRPEYLAEVLRSWEGCRLVRDTRFQFAVEPSPQLQQVLDVIATFRAGQVEVIVNDKVEGVLHNPWLALNRAFDSGADFAVLAEDDVLVASDFLEFMRWASKHHALNRSVLVASGHSLVGGIPDGAVVTDRAFSGLGWGTWRNRWEAVLRDTWDHDYSSGVDGVHAGWDWNITERVMPATRTLQVRPVVSRTQHIGRHHGVHTDESSWPGSVVAGWQQRVKVDRFHMVDFV
jgi:hypothetical protein